LAEPKTGGCASVVDPAALDTQGEAKKILNLTRRQYNKQIGLFAFNTKKS